MRVCAVSIITIAALAIGTGPSARSADENDFQQTILRLEKTVETLVARETAERKQDVARLESVFLVHQEQTDSAALGHLEELQNRLQVLEAKVAALTGQSNSSRLSVDEQTLLDLINDIAYLKAENEYLRRRVDNHSTELASLNPGFVTPEPVRREPKESPDLAGIELSGFVDGSNYTDYNSGTSDFGVDQIEIDAVRTFSDRASLQTDVEFLNDGAGGFEFNIEQGFLWYRSSSSTSFAFGKFNAPIGFEGADPVEMFQYSGGLSGEYGLPGDMTGLSFTFASGPLEWTSYVVNGWDVNADNNKEKTVGSRIELAPVKSFAVGLAAVSGAENDDNNSSRRTVLNLDWSFTPAEYILIGGELLYGAETGLLAGDKTAAFSGGLIMSNVALSEKVSLTGRFSFFDDPDGVRTGAPQTLSEITLAPAVSIIDGLRGLLELRCDMSNQPAFTDSDGLPTDSKLSTALEFTYGF